MTRYGAYGGHHIGTTRMGNDRRSSVVDANCRLHDVENLYIAGSSVFPTSSQANPTLTIVALALRLSRAFECLGLFRVTERVLVLGARGFIGRRVVSQLSQCPEFVVVAAGHRAMAKHSPGQVEAQVVDATDPESVRRALVGIDCVVNCVAAGPETLLSAARVVFDAAAQSRPTPRIVHFSSLLAYGTMEGLVDETMAPRGDLGPYSAAKVTTEKLAAGLQSVVTLRPGIVYGPAVPGGAIESRGFCVPIGWEIWVAAGEGYCNLVYVDDVASAAVRALRTEAAKGRILNLGSPKVPTWNEYFEIYARMLGALPLRRISPRRLKIEQSVIAPPLKVLELASRSNCCAEWRFRRPSGRGCSSTVAIASPWASAARNGRSVCNGLPSRRDLSRPLPGFSAEAAVSEAGGAAHRAATEPGAAASWPET